MCFPQGADFQVSVPLYEASALAPPPRVMGKGGAQNISHFSSTYYVFTSSTYYVSDEEGARESLPVDVEYLPCALCFEESGAWLSIDGSVPGEVELYALFCKSRAENVGRSPREGVPRPEMGRPWQGMDGQPWEVSSPGPYRRAHSGAP